MAAKRRDLHRRNTAAARIRRGDNFSIGERGTRRRRSQEGPRVPQLQGDLANRTHDACYGHVLGRSFQGFILERLKRDRIASGAVDDRAHSGEGLRIEP